MPYLAMAILIRLVLTDCLDSETLTSIGFPQASESTSNRTLCPQLSSNSTACVSQSQLNGVYNLIQQNMTLVLNLSNNLLFQLGKLKTAFENNYASYLELNVQMLKKPILTFNKVMSVVQKMSLNPFLVVTPPRRDLNSTLSSEKVTISNDTILASYEYLVGYLERVNNLAISGQLTCLLGYFNITFASYCLLGSTSGQQVVTSEKVSDNESLGVLTNTPTVGLVLTQCLSLIEVYCLMNYGVSVSDTVFTDSNMNSVIPDQNSFLTKVVCLELQGLYNCTNPFCLQQLSAILINDVFSFSTVSFLANSASLGLVVNSVNQVISILNLFGANEPIESNLWGNKGYLSDLEGSFQRQVLFLVADNFGGFLGPEGGDTGANFTFGTLS